MRPVLALLAGTLLAPACSDYEFVENKDADGSGGPQIHVDPETLNLGSARREEVVTGTFTVTNVGEGDLDVAAVELVDTTGSFSILTTELDFLLPPSASQDIEVAFTPMGADQLTAQAVVYSNDEDDPSVPVELIAQGLVPDLLIDPNPYDFGDTYIGCPHEGVITLENIGYDALTMDSVSLLGGGGTFAMLSTVPVPMTLQPGESTTVDIQFNPTSNTDFAAVLSVTHDAPGGEDIGDVGGAGKYAGDFTDTWAIPEEPPVDLIFSVDQSGSMDDDARSLADNFSTFITQLSTYTTDWQIIVVNDDDGCNNSGGVLTATTPGYVNTFRNAVQQGGGRYTEALLTVTSIAVEKTDTAECNYGFMRPDALLHIIMVSDEPEQSSGSWSTYVSQIIAKKGSSSNVRLSAIAGDYPRGCGTADAGTGYYEAVSATGGLFLSICSAWSTMVEDLADASIQLSEYELSHTADPNTIVVKVNGATRSAGWTYDSATNIVEITANIPVGGDTVTIDYSALANCD